MSEQILNFFIEVESVNIKFKHKKEENEEIKYEDGKKLLIEYLNQQLNIKKENLIQIIEYLLKNGLKNILIRQINIVMNYGKENLQNFKNIINLFQK